MAKSLTLKIKRAKIINSLNESLAKRTKRYSTQEQERAKYEKAVEAYNLAVVKLIKAGKGTVEEASRNEWYERDHKTKGKLAFSVTVLVPVGSLPDEPVAPSTYHKWEYERDTEAISNALRMLEMCDEEYVSAGTLKSISEYL